MYMRMHDMDMCLHNCIVYHLPPHVGNSRVLNPFKMPMTNLNMPQLGLRIQIRYVT